MVYGEHPQFKAEWIKETILTAYSVKSGNGEIRRINVNVAPMDVEDFRILKSSGIGTYQCFQETYHRKLMKGTYRWEEKGLPLQVVCFRQSTGSGN